HNVTNHSNPVLMTGGAPTRVITQAGYYRLTVNNISHGCVGVDSIQIGFSNPITASAGADIMICEDDSTVLLATSSDPLATFQWVGGPATASWQVGPTTITTYQLVATGANGCKVNDSIEVSLAPRPIVNLGNDTTFCGNTLFLDAGNPTLTYLWSTNETTQIIGALASGLQLPDTFWVDVSDANCTTRDSIAINFKTIPVVNLGADTMVCGNIFLDAGPGNGYKYIWNTTDTTQTIYAQDSPSPWPPKAYYVKVTDTNNTCVGSDTINIIFNPAPVAPFGYTTVTDCESLRVLNAQNTGSTYIWNTGANTDTINVITSGWYWVDITNNYGCKTSDTIQVIFHAKPIVDLGADRKQCGGFVQLNSGHTSPPNTIDWGTGATTGIIPVFTSGNYYCTVTNSSGCKNSDTVRVDINPPALINAGADRRICEGSAATLIGSGGITYTWNPGGHNINPYIPSVKVNTTYTVTGTDANGCSGSDNVTVTLDSLPEASFTDVQDINNPLKWEFFNTSSNANNYYWSFGDGQSSTLTSPSYTYNSPGNYKVMLIAVNTCGNDTAYSDKLNSINELEASYKMELFPNPTQGNFSLSFNNPISQRVNIRITDLGGKAIYSEQLEYSGGNHLKTFDLRNVESGVYFLQFITEDSVINKKIILNR
ncbi:MAG: T9SS type A sorting domain-containing protein, partial [Bacteroidetes bacterium]|nr:T9SS type A sorting domain-containing protein [Bacteroidota bacterium]